MKRREFIECVACGMFGLAFLPGCASRPTYRSYLIEGRVVLSVAEFDDAARGERILVVEAEEMRDPILLIRVERAVYRALSSVCTHQGCHVRPAGGFLQCPCHGSTYDLEGEVVRGPAPAPLYEYPVTFDNGMIKIEVS